jgi:phage-related holin
MKASIITSAIFTILNINFNIVPPAHLFGIIGIAMLIDLITGVAKAVYMNEARTSHGYRRTVKKFIQYGGSIAVTMLIRYLISKQPELTAGIKYLNWLGSGLMVFIILIECTSILENIYAIDKTSSFSRYLIKPLLKILTIQLKENSIINPSKNI